jgi:cytochrome c-type biogenesis protein
MQKECGHLQYLVSFLEGIITFISPCLLPMLPIYISYFAGGGERRTGKTLLCAVGFVAGFTAVIMAMGALAGTVGSFLREYQTMVNLVCGAIVILFGLNYLGVLKLNLFKGAGQGMENRNMGFFSAFLFGVIFSVGWTPCVGAFLGSALMLASTQAHMVQGMLMLLAYSMGLGIPFMMSAVLIDYLKSAYQEIASYAAQMCTGTNVPVQVLEVKAYEVMLEAYQAEIDVLMEYMPQQLTDEEIMNIVKETAAGLDIEEGSGKKSMGKLMGPVMGKVKGLADGNDVKNVVLKFLG